MRRASFWATIRRRRAGSCTRSAATVGGRQVGSVAVLLGRVAEWQTRWLQVPVRVSSWGFKSPLAHGKTPAQQGVSEGLETGRLLPDFYPPRANGAASLSLRGRDDLPPALARRCSGGHERPTHSCRRRCGATDSGAPGVPSKPSGSASADVCDRDVTLTIPSGGSVFVEFVEHDSAGDTFATNERRVRALHALVLCKHRRPSRALSGAIEPAIEATSGQRCSVILGCLHRPLMAAVQPFVGFVNTSALFIRPGRFDAGQDPVDARRAAVDVVDHPGPEQRRRRSRQA